MVAEFDSRLKIFGLNPRLFYNYIKNFSNIIAITIIVVYLSTYKTIDNLPHSGVA